MTVEIEDIVIQLDHQLIDHLSDDESARRLYADKFLPEFLLQTEAEATQVLLYQFDEIRKRGKPASRQELEYAFDFISFDEPACDVGWLIEQFKTRYIRNKSSDLIEWASEQNHIDPRGVVERLMTEATHLRDAGREHTIVVTTHDYKQVLDEHFRELKENGISGVSYGFPEIDEHLMGLRRGHLHFVIGRPKRFKSWMLMKSAVACQQSGLTPVFFSLEIPKEEMFMRYACMMASVSWSDFTHNCLMPDELRRLYETMESFADMENQMVILQPPLGQRTMGDLKALAKDYNADAMYVDQISFVESRRKYGDKQHMEIAEICTEMKADTCMEFPLYVAAQFSREAANLKEMGDTAKIGLSDAIGQKADVLLGLYQSKEMRKSQSLEFGVIDARSYDLLSWEVHVGLSRNTNFKVVGLREDAG